MTANQSVTRRRFATGWVGLLLAGWLALGTTWAVPVVHYLTVAGAGSEDGSSFDHAGKDIQAALDRADIDEIRMAGGIYDLTVALSWAAGTNVAVRGGYDAATGIHDPDNQVTILRQTVSEQRVILMEDLVDCRLEYVTLTGGTVGTPDADGAGMRILNSDIEIIDSVISNNVTSVRRENRNGGGIHVVGGSVEFLRCRIENNRIDLDSHIQTFTGGGIYVTGGSTVIRHSRIAGNVLRVTDSFGLSTARGAGLYLAGGGSLLVENSSIVSNICGRTDRSMTGFAAGAGHAAGSALTLRNCLIYGNANLSDNGNLSRAGAGVILENGGLIENCTIAGNRMYHETEIGAGLVVNGGTVSNTIVYANWRHETQQDIGFGGGATEAGNVFYSCAPELTAELNHNINDDPLFIDADAGDFRLQSRYGQYTPTGALIYHAQTSPAMDAGINQSWMIDALDLQGFPRIVRGVPRSPGPANVDMGAYEVNAPLPGTLFLFR